MPMGSLEDVDARLAFGEDALEQIAQRARLSRLLDASISVVTGALVLPIYFIPRSFVFDSAFDYFVLIGADFGVRIVGAGVGPTPYGHGAAATISAAF